MIWQKQEISESKGDKLSSSAECRMTFKIYVKVRGQYANDHLCLRWKESMENCRSGHKMWDRQTDGRTEWNQYTHQQLRCAGGILTYLGETVMPVRCVIFLLVSLKTWHRAMYNIWALWWNSLCSLLIMLQGGLMEVRPIRDIVAAA